MTRRQFLRVAATAALCGIPARVGAAPVVGKPAPEFSLPLFDGRVISLEEFRGRPILVNFFNSG